MASMMYYCAVIAVLMMHTLYNSAITSHNEPNKNPTIRHTQKLFAISMSYVILSCNHYEKY